MGNRSRLKMRNRLVNIGPELRAFSVLHQDQFVGRRSLANTVRPPRRHPGLPRNASTRPSTARGANSDESCLLRSERVQDASSSTLTAIFMPEASILSVSAELSCQS